MQTLVADHPLVAHKLTALRDIQTETPTFRRLADELVTLLAYEATRHVRVEPATVPTPVGQAEGVKLAKPVPAHRARATGRGGHAGRHDPAAAQCRRRVHWHGQGRGNPAADDLRGQAA